MSHKFLRQYPSTLLDLWQEALKAINTSSDFPVTAVTFGSLPIGEFTWVQDRDKVLLVSDFEFTILVPSNAVCEIRPRIRDRLNIYNSCFAPKHLGFHVNARVDEWTGFLKRLQSDMYFHNSILQTGVILFGHGHIPKEYYQMKAASVPYRQLAQVVDGLCMRLLIQLDRRIVPIPDLYPGYASIIVSKSIIKLATILASLIDNQPSSTGQTQKILDRHKIYESQYLKRIRECLSKHQIPKRFEIEIQDLFILFLNRVLRELSDHEVDLENVVNTNGISIQLVQEHIIDHACTRLRLEVQLERSRLIREWLKQRPEHYDYYKRLYDVL